MIKEKELREMRPQARFKDGSDLTLETLQDAIQNLADHYGIPTAFHKDQIKYGGLIGGTVADCLVLYHPSHEKDYFQFAIQIKHQGSYAFLSVHDFGSSKLMDNQASHDLMVSTVKNSWKDKNSNGTEAVGVVIGAGLRRIVKGGRNNLKLEEEQNWYSMISDIFDELIQ